VRAAPGAAHVRVAAGERRGPLHAQGLLGTRSGPTTGSPSNLREHQDAFEFFNRLYDLLDERLKKQPLPPTHHPGHLAQAQAHAQVPEGGGIGQKGGVPTLTSIFGGVFSQQVICKTCPLRSEREEPFAAVSVDVMNKKGLEDSLAAFVRGDLLEADNAYYCEACGVKVDALKRACVKALPPSLIIHLKRFDFDSRDHAAPEAQGPLRVPPALNMMPYTVEGLDARGAQRPLLRRQPPTPPGRRRRPQHAADAGVLRVGQPRPLPTWPQHLHLKAVPGQRQTAGRT